MPILLTLAHRRGRSHPSSSVHRPSQSRALSIPCVVEGRGGGGKRKSPVRNRKAVPLNRRPILFSALRVLWGGGGLKVRGPVPSHRSHTHQYGPTSLSHTSGRYIVSLHIRSSALTSSIPGAQPTRLSGLIGGEGEGEEWGCSFASVVVSSILAAVRRSVIYSMRGGRGRGEKPKVRLLSKDPV